jgi:hypothetical protein
VASGERRRGRRPGLALVAIAVVACGAWRGGAAMTDRALADCGARWAAEVAPTPARTEACARRWLQVAYGSNDPAELDFDPRPGHAVELAVTAAELRAMAAHARAAAPADVPPTHWAARAAEYFEVAADHRFKLGQDENLVDFEPLLAKVLAGEPLTPDDLQPVPELTWDAVVRWRLAAAVRARHGAPLGHPDLERFFYEAGAVQGTALLPVRRAAGEPSPLTDVDRANLALIEG